MYDLTVSSVVLIASATSRIDRPPAYSTRARCSCWPSRGSSSAWKSCIACWTSALCRGVPSAAAWMLAISSSDDSALGTTADAPARMAPWMVEGSACVLRSTDVRPAPVSVRIFCATGTSSRRARSRTTTSKASGKRSSRTSPFHVGEVAITSTPVRGRESRARRPSSRRTWSSTSATRTRWPWPVACSGRRLIGAPLVRRCPEGAACSQWKHWPHDVAGDAARGTHPRLGRSYAGASRRRASSRPTASFSMRNPSSP